MNLQTSIPSDATIQPHWQCRRRETACLAWTRWQPVNFSAGKRVGDYPELEFRDPSSMAEYVAEIQELGIGYHGPKRGGE